MDKEFKERGTIHPGPKGLGFLASKDKGMPVSAEKKKKISDSLKKYYEGKRKICGPF